MLCPRQRISIKLSQIIKKRQETSPSETPVILNFILPTLNSTLPSPMEFLVLLGNKVKLVSFTVITFPSFIEFLIFYNKIKYNVI